MKWKWSALVFCATGFAQSTLFFNANIISSFSSLENPTRELLVRDSKVVKIGNRLEVPSETVRVDLQGKWVFPALADSHVHLLSTGHEKTQLNLRGKSLEEIRELLVQSLAKKPRILVGFGWDQNLWPNKSMPQIKFLDSISKDIPLILFRVDGHAAWANSIALEKAGLKKKEVVVDLGLEQLQKLIPNSTQKEMEEEIKSVVKEALKNGVTSLHDAGISKREFDVLKRTIKKENLPFRFYEMASSANRKELEQILKNGPQDGLLDSRLSLRTVKVYLDGALGSRGALFDNPYEDDPKNRGIQIWKEDELEELVRMIDRHGFQVAVHAIGSRANEIAIHVFEKVWGKNTKIKRPRIEHAQVLSENLINKIGQLGIVASMQPVHCSSDSSWVIDRIGKSRARFSYPWRSLLKAKAPLAFGTDSPIEDFTPWPGLFSSVTRHFFPEEAISLREALLAFTEGAAYSSFQEASLGSLEPGKWADFFVLDKNLMELEPEEILKQEVQATYFGGTRVYKK